MGKRFYRDLLILSLSSLFMRGVGVIWSGYLSRRMSGGHPEWHIMDDVLKYINGNCQFFTVGGGVLPD